MVHRVTVQTKSGGMLLRATIPTMVFQLMFTGNIRLSPDEPFVIELDGEKIWDSETDRAEDSD